MPTSRDQAEALADQAKSEGSLPEVRWLSQREEHQPLRALSVENQRLRAPASQVPSMNRRDRQHQHRGIVLVPEPRFVQLPLFVELQP